MVRRAGRHIAYGFAWLDDVHHFRATTPQAVHDIGPARPTEHADTHEVVLAQSLEGAELARGLVAQEIEIHPVRQLGLVCLKLLRRFVELVQCGRHALFLHHPAPMSGCLMVRPARLSRVYQRPVLPTRLLP